MSGNVAFATKLPADVKRQLDELCGRFLPLAEVERELRRRKKI